LQSQYRRAVDLGPKELEAAGKGIERLESLERAAGTAGLDADSAAFDEPSLDRFRAAMDDDFNSPGAVAVIFEAVRDANRALDAGDRDRAAVLVATVRELAGVLGLVIGGDDEHADGDAEIDALVRERDEARAARDFARADAVRDDLTTRGIKLEDTPSGTVWHR
jgi:cysteinyl-tRNA synthetase